MAARDGKTDRIAMAHRISEEKGNESASRPGPLHWLRDLPDVAPEVFEMGTDDKAHTKVDPVPEELQAACKDAADQCPQAAIEVD